jgi:hypothetical protein
VTDGPRALHLFIAEHAMLLADTGPVQNIAGLWGGYVSVVSLRACSAGTLLLLSSTFDTLQLLTCLLYQNISGIMKASNGNISTPTHTVNLGNNPYLVSAPFLHLPQLLSLPGLIGNVTPINAIDDISADICESVDAIFISNQNSMWALPALLKRFRVRAKVFATKATKHFGRFRVKIPSMFTTFFCLIARRTCCRMLIDEFHSLIDANPSVSRSTHWNFAYSLGLRNALFEPCYSASELQSCWSDVQTVSFNEPIALSPLLTGISFAWHF